VSDALGLKKRGCKGGEKPGRKVLGGRPLPELWENDEDLNTVDRFRTNKKKKRNKERRHRVGGPARGRRAYLPGKGKTVLGQSGWEKIFPGEDKTLRKKEAFTASVTGPRKRGRLDNPEKIGGGSSPFRSTGGEPKTIKNGEKDYVEGRNAWKRCSARQQGPPRETIIGGKTVARGKITVAKKRDVLVHRGTLKKKKIETGQLEGTGNE